MRATGVSIVAHRARLRCGSSCFSAVAGADERGPQVIGPGLRLMGCRARRVGVAVAMVGGVGCSVDVGGG